MVAGQRSTLAFRAKSLVDDVVNFLQKCEFLCVEKIGEFFFKSGQNGILIDLAGGNPEQTNENLGKKDKIMVVQNDVKHPES